MEEDVEDNGRVMAKNQLMCENIAKLTVEELAKAVAASMTLEEDDEFRLQPAMLPPRLSTNALTDHSDLN